MKAIEEIFRQEKCSRTGFCGQLTDKLAEKKNFILLLNLRKAQAADCVVKESIVYQNGEPMMFCPFCAGILFPDSR